MYFRVQLIFAVLFPLFQIRGSESANILFYHLISSYSHRIAVWPLVEALASRGHNVTFHQSHPPKMPNPKVREFYPTSLGNIWEFENEDGTVSLPDLTLLQVRLEEGGPIGYHKASIPFFSHVLHRCDKLLSNSEVRDFVNSNSFDLVVIDALWNECAYGLAHKWGAKTIVYHSSAPSGVGAIEPLGFLGTDELWITDQTVSFRMPMTFLQRVTTALYTTLMHCIKEWVYYPRLRSLFETKLNISNIPSVPEMLRETSLVLHNSHFSEEEARSLPPLYVSVPAMHAWETKAGPLPKNIAHFVEESGEDGFIYVSFGTEADMATAPQEFLNIFLNVFARSKIRFLWKFSGERPKGLSGNVFTQDWMPQRDILASPKCKGFITHGGLLGIQEATLLGIPMIAMPVFAEQDFNAFRLERSGRGIKLEIGTLSVKDLEWAITEILTNRSYKENVEKVSKQLKDQQNSPIDTAVFWTEYVLRNEDLSTLRPLMRRDFYWFQIYFIDVWAFLALVGFTLVYILIYISKNILLYCFSIQKSRSTGKLKKT